MKHTHFAHFYPNLLRLPYKSKHNKLLAMSFPMCFLLLGVKVSYAFAW